MLMLIFEVSFRLSSMMPVKEFGSGTCPGVNPFLLTNYPVFSQLITGGKSNGGFSGMLFVNLMRFSSLKS